MIFYRLSVLLWWSKSRWIFEPIVRRLLQGARDIKTGPLRGHQFRGGLAQMLGIYEVSIQSTINHYIAPGDVFYDIGANNGFFTLFACQRVGTDGSVFSFEPFPENAKSIQNVIRDNHLTNCHLEECAVADFVGETNLYFDGSLATPSITHQAMEMSTSILVPTITLDEYLLSHPKPSLIKLDVEGAEVAVLKGARSLIASESPPTWIIEVHNPLDVREICSLLLPGKYEIEQLPKPGKQGNIFPVHMIAFRHEE